MSEITPEEEVVETDERIKKLAYLSLVNHSTISADAAVVLYNTLNNDTITKADALEMKLGVDETCKYASEEEEVAIALLNHSDMSGEAIIELLDLFEIEAPYATSAPTLAYMLRNKDLESETDYDDIGIELFYGLLNQTALPTNITIEYEPCDDYKDSIDAQVKAVICDFLDNITHDDEDAFDEFVAQFKEVEEEDINPNLG